MDFILKRKKFWIENLNYKIRSIVLFDILWNLPINFLFSCFKSTTVFIHVASLLQKLFVWQVFFQKCVYFINNPIFNLQWYLLNLLSRKFLFAIFKKIFKCNLHIWWCLHQVIILTIQSHLDNWPLSTPLKNYLHYIGWCSGPIYCKWNHPMGRGCCTAYVRRELNSNTQAYIRSFLL